MADNKVITRDDLDRIKLEVAQLELQVAEKEAELGRSVEYLGLAQRREVLQERLVELNAD